MIDPSFNDLVKEVVSKQDLPDDSAEFAIKYFNYFFHNPSTGDMTIESIPEYVKQFQSLIGVEVTGNLDAQVVRAMKTMPRCGCRDYNLISPFAFGNAPKWGPGVIKYFIQRYVTGLSTNDQDDLLRMAFQSWADVADLAFERTTQQSGANIVISTGRGSADNFDGPSGTLAWAYLPPQAGFRGQLLMRFDIDETWIANKNDRGILYLNVAAHEFGHLLGLDHSKNSKALMAPYYSAAIAKPQQNDDVKRIQALYGAPTTPPPPPPPPPPPSPPSGRIKIEIEVDSLDDVKINGKAPLNFDLI